MIFAFEDEGYILRLAAVRFGSSSASHGPWLGLKRCCFVDVVRNSTWRVRWFASSFTDEISFDVMIEIK